MQREIIHESVENSWRECQKICLAVEKTHSTVACNYWVWHTDINPTWPRICSLASGIFVTSSFKEIMLIFGQEIPKNVKASDLTMILDYISIFIFVEHKS